jgi:PAS domain S-box-containing protein
MTGELLLNVDDDLAGRYAVTRVLRHAGYEVLEAASGGQALEIIRERHPALVLLDVNLPDGSGFELSARIKADAETADVLILQHSASFVRPSDQARGLERGADSYLTVPIEPEVLLATVRSLLRLRQAERVVHASARQWQTTFDAISDAVAVLGPDMRIERSNRAFAMLAGRGSDDLAGCAWSDVLPGVPLALESSGNAAGASSRVDAEVKHRDRWYRVVADPVQSARGERAGCVCVLSDIDDRKRAEDERRELLERERLARTRAESAARAKDEFLAVLSHELRTPLNAVLGWARMLTLETLDPGRVKHAAATIERNARAQAQLIEDLLDVSRAVSGHLPLDPAPVDILPIVTSAIEIVQIAASGRGVALHLDPGESGLRVMADATRLRQVLWNLLSNAIKFTPAGGRVDIAIRDAAGTVEVVVRDTGIGIRPEALPYVFDRFWQAQPPGGRPAGLGLGLAIVRHIVESHGGSVDVRSDGEGRGATFVVRLPVLRDSAGA